jgi:hypothetical protein
MYADTLSLLRAIPAQPERRSFSVRGSKTMFGSHKLCPFSAAGLSVKASGTYSSFHCL